jgi:hypothetical protein
MSASVDNPAVERPIHIDNLSRTREYSYRAEAADGIERVPISPADSIWDQLSQIPPSQPALTVNAGPIGVVERVAMVLRPVAGSTLKWEFASWVGDGPPNPPSVPISRVIPASFGNKDGVPGAYLPTLTGAPAYNGHTWIVDGLNHYVEFPYGSPAGLADPVLTFYRYTGTTGGGQGAPTIMYLNRAVYDETASITIYVWPSPTFIGSEGEYDPSHRIIPTDNLYPVNSTFSFEASGLYRASVRGADLKSHPQFGIMVGDYDATNGVLGLITLELDPSFYDTLSTWSYKLIATQVESNPGSNGLRFIWTADATMCLKDQNGGDVAPELFVRQSGVGDMRFGSVQPVPGGYQFSVHAANLDLPPEHTPGPSAPSITVYKFNHLFKQIA